MKAYRSHLLVLVLLCLLNPSTVFAAVCDADVDVDRNDVIQIALARDRSIEIVELDLYGLSQKIATDPDAFGFTNAYDSARAAIDDGGQPANVTVAEMGTVVNPDDHIFYDDVYPTSKWHQILAARALQGLSGMTP